MFPICFLFRTDSVQIVSRKAYLAKTKGQHGLRLTRVLRLPEANPMVGDHTV
jgi:hypothetical protein